MKSLCINCFKNLGVESRSKIYVLLSEQGRSNVKEITQSIGLKQPTVSYHLKEMQETGLLRRIVRGKEVFYDVNAKCPRDGKRCIVC